MGNACGAPKKNDAESMGMGASVIAAEAADKVEKNFVEYSRAHANSPQEEVDASKEGGSKSYSAVITEGSEHDTLSHLGTDDLDADEAEKAEFVVSLGNFMHLMQRERGISAIYCDTGISKEKVKAIRRETSAMWKSLAQNVTEAVAEILELIGMQRLKECYPKVEKRNATYLEVILQIYNPCLEQIMAAINRASKNLKSTTIGGEVNSHIAFLSLKEAVGRERALVGGALGHREMTVEAFRELITLLGMQRAYESMFEVSAPADLLQMYYQTCTKPGAVFEVEETILSGLDGITRVQAEMNATAWYDLLTLRIDRMEKIRQALAEDIRKGVTEGLSRHKSYTSELKKTLEHLQTQHPSSPSTPQGDRSRTGSTGSTGVSGDRPKERKKRESKAEKWLIDGADLELIEEIGKGSTGSTYRANWHGTPVAVKVVDDALAVTSRKNTAVKEFKVEVEILNRLRHPNICLYLGAAVKHPRYCLVLEYMKGGTVFDLIRRDPDAVDFFRCAMDVARAMQYVHDHCKMMHRDLKTPNLLCDDMGTVKISDFGLSCLEDRENKMAKTGEIGTYRWMAPEVIMHEPYGTPADVYSYGIVLWELLTAKMPFKGLSPIKAAMGVVVEQLRPTLPEGTPNGVMSLVSSCWSASPDDRPSFRDIINMLVDLEQKEGAEIRKLVPSIRRDPSRPTYSYLGLGGGGEGASPPCPSLMEEQLGEVSGAGSSWAQSGGVKGAGLST